MDCISTIKFSSNEELKLESNCESEHETDWIGKVSTSSCLLPHIQYTLFPEKEVRAASRLTFNKENMLEPNIEPSDELRQFLKRAPISTMVIIYRLLGSIDINTFFPLLRITQVEDPNPTAKNAKSPFYPQPGHIVSARYSDAERKDMYRGFVPRPRKKAFLNCITVDISTKLKNVSLKISKGTIQECGAVSIENGIEAVQHLIGHIYSVDGYLKYIQCNKSMAEEIVNWLSFSCQGDIYNDENGHRLTALFQPRIIPSSLDSNIVSWFLSFMQDYNTYEGYMGVVKWIITKTHIIEGDGCLSVDFCTKEMVNHKYSLNQTLNKRRLVEIFYNQPGFYIDYDNEIDSQVSIQVPYGLKKVGNKKISCITFLICKTGTITQTGPNELYNFLSYGELKKILLQHHQYICIGASKLSSDTNTSESSSLP